MSPDEQIAARAAKQHGVFTTRDALDAGLTKDAIKHRLRTRRWRALHRGVYAVSGAPATKEQRIIAAVLSFGPSAMAGGLTAASLYKLVEKLAETICVVLPTGQHRRARKGVATIQASLARSDRRTACGIPVTSPNRTIVDIAAVLGRDALAAAFDEAVLRGLTTVGSLRRYVADRRLQHLRGAGKLREVLNDRTKGVPQRELERLFLKKLRASGLPEPVRQHPVGKRKIDFAYPDYRIAIELDGLGDHFSAEAFRNDRRRQNEIVLAGFTILRFTWEDVNDRWPDVLRTLRAALAD
jgi:very-short-patch-repair endonuclease/predicted transcriptional regulator of viral defense system